MFYPLNQEDTVFLQQRYGIISDSAKIGAVLVLSFGHIPIDLCGYDHLLLRHHRRSAPPREAGGESGVSRLLLRRRHLTLRKAGIRGVPGRKSD